MAESASIKKLSPTRSAALESFEAWARTLESAGLSFNPESRRWQYLQSATQTSEKPLTLGGLNVLFRRSRIEVEEVSYKLNLPRWGKCLQNAARETWGSRTRAELHAPVSTAADTRFWIVLEFSRPGSSEQVKGYSRLFDHSRFPAGILIAGVTLTPSQEGMRIATIGICSAGFLPANVWERFPFFLRRSLQMPGTPRIQAGEHAGNFLSQIVAAAELTGSVDHDASQTLQEALKPAQSRVDSFMNKGFVAPITDSHGNLNWKIRPATGPIQSAADPELASAQTLVAELIVTPDKRDAKLASLQSARGKWLDDPVFALLDASLSVSAGLLKGNHADTLDAVSGLVRKLNEIWPGVDASPIATTIISEIIGDTWAGLPTKEGSFERAKAAWSKAAATRAHPLRILKKIAATARSRGLHHEESAALEQIILQEKRRNELASALVRLAAIYQQENPALSAPGNRTPGQLLEMAAATCPDEPAVLEALFLYLVETGATARALTTGKDLLAAWRIAGLNDKIADITFAMAKIELRNGDVEGAGRLFIEANHAAPHRPGPLLELARIAGVRQDHGTRKTYLEKALTQLLKFETKNRESLLMLHEATLEYLNIPGLKAASDPMVVGLIQRCLRPEGQALITELSSKWHSVIENMAFESGNVELKLELARLLLLITRRQDPSKAPPASTAAIAARLASACDTASITVAMDLIALACRVAPPGTGAAENRQELGDQVAGLLQMVIRNHHTIPDAFGWLETNLERAVEQIDPAAALMLLLDALHVPGGMDPSRSLKDGGWLTAAIKKSITRWNGSSREPAASDDSTRVLHLKLGLEMLRQSAAYCTIDDTTATVSWLVGENPSITHLIVRAMEPSTHSAGKLTGKNFSSITLLTRMLGMSGEPQWTDVLTSRIFSRLKDEEPFPTQETLNALENAVADTAHRRQLKVQELAFLIQRANDAMQDKTFDGLLDQATFVENEAKSAHLFKLCLDHVLLRKGDEGLAGKVLTLWLNRLQGSGPGKASDSKTELKEATLGQLAAELLRLQTELGLPAQDDAFGSLRENLARAGLVPPENPARELMEAIKQKDFDHLDRMLKMLQAQSPTAMDDAIQLLFASLKQQRVPVVDPSAAIAALLATKNIQDLLSRASAVSPATENATLHPAITIALLAADHLQDRDQAMQLLQSMATAHPEEKRLWIPLYLLIGEKDDAPAMITYLEKILPELRGNQDILADYPFTIESLEAELARLKSGDQGTLEFQPQPSQQNPALEFQDAGRAPSSTNAIDFFEPSAKPLTALVNDQYNDAFSQAATNESAESLPDPSSGPLTHQLTETPTELFTEPFTKSIPEPLSHTIGGGENQLQHPEWKTNQDIAAPTLLESNPEKIADEVAEHAPPQGGDSLPVPADIPPVVEEIAQAPKQDITAAAQPTTDVAPVHVDAQPPPAKAATPDLPPKVDQGLDWRTVVRERKAPPGLVQTILDQQFNSKLEKHLALQAIAVMRGEVHLLERWDWRVWRKAHEYGYERSGKKRFPAGLSPRIMKSNEFKLLMRAGPVLARAFKDRFTINGLAKTLNIPVRQVMSKRQRLDWSTGLAGYAGFSHHANSLKQSGLELFSMQGLGPQIFFEMEQKAIYVDDSYFSRRPPSHFYHRIMFLLYALRIGFFFLINLGAEQHIQPELEKFRGILKKGGLAVVAAKAKLTDCKMAKAMTPADFDEITMLFDRCGSITTDDINDMTKAMQQYIWRMMLADSVNLVGILEAMLDVDMALPGSIKENEVLLMSPQVDPLLNFALAMDLGLQDSA